MKTGKVLFLKREDLRYKEKEFSLITFVDFKGSIEPLQSHGMVVFIDEDGQSKILKNRYYSEMILVDLFKAAAQNLNDTELGKVIRKLVNSL